MRLLAKSISLLGSAWSFLFSYRLRSRFRLIGTYFLSGMMKREFKSCGKGVVINKGFKLKGGQYISIGENTVFGKHAEITAHDSFNGQPYTPEIIIGDNVFANDYPHITCICRIVLGNDVWFGRRVTITDNAHGESTYHNMSIPVPQRELSSHGPVIIGDRVWIGENSVVLPGVQIGEGSIIGANSVVTRDVPAFSVAVGAPAKVIRQVIEK